MRRITIVCCSEIADPSWRWIEACLPDAEVQFEFARCPPARGEQKFARFSFARLRLSLEAVRMAHRSRAQVLVTHGPTLAAWCALLMRAFGLEISILAHSFNFTTLPNVFKRAVFRFAFSRIERFVVFSRLEREIYSKYFRIPIDRFDFVYWGVRPPNVEDSVSFEKEYVSAIGGNARDYRTLVDAAWKLPEVSFVLVVRPENLRGLKLPPNVTFHANVPFEKAMSVLLHSRFMVLPLLRSDVPCGHVTLVAAMHLGKAFIITDSSGVRDYVRDGDNALTVTVGSTESLVSATKRLWHDQDLCTFLGKNGHRFASGKCTETRIAEHFRDWLRARQNGHV